MSALVEDSGQGARHDVIQFEGKLSVLTKTPDVYLSLKMI